MHDETTAAAPAAARIIAKAHDYAELLDALRTRCHALGTGAERVDGIPERFTITMFSQIQIKSITRISLGVILAALGLKLIVTDDPVAWARVQHRHVRSKYAGTRGASTKRHANRHLIFRRNPALAREFRHLQILKQPARKRTEIARKAALARWSDVKRAAKGE